MFVRLAAQQTPVAVGLVWDGCDLSKAVGLGHIVMTVAGLCAPPYLILFVVSASSGSSIVYRRV